MASSSAGGGGGVNGGSGRETPPVAAAAVIVSGEKRSSLMEEMAEAARMPEVAAMCRGTVFEARRHVIAALEAGERSDGVAD